MPSAASNLAKIGRIVVPARAEAKFTWILPSVADNADSTKSKPKWWNGRHEGLKIPWPQGCAGSSPAFGTKNERNSENLREMCAPRTCCPSKVINPYLFFFLSTLTEYIHIIQ